MDLNRQVFKAPSIPKLGKRTVSSSVLSGAIKPQITLKATKFSFIKPVSKTEDIEKISKVNVEKNVSVEATLSETNRILVEIQKQLAFDFAYRIAEEKKALAVEKKKIAAKKVSDKEAKIEKGRKNIVGKTFEKVTAPFKSIFQKLIDFFSIILTGILYNTAFEWLKDKNNQKKLTEFFDFIKEYWQELLIIFAAYKIAKLVGVVAGIALKIKKLLKWFGRFKLPKFRRPSAGLGIGKALQATQKVALNQAKKKAAENVVAKGVSSAGIMYIDPDTYTQKWSGFVDAAEANKLLKKPNILQRGLQTVSGFGNKLGSTLVRPIIDVVLPKVPPKVKEKIVGAVASKGLKRFLPFVNTLFGTVEGISRIMEGDIEGALLSFASAIPIAGWAALALDIYRSADPEGYKKNIRFGLSSEEINRTIGEGFGNMGTVGMSGGGTVGQGDRPGVDTTPAFMRSGQKILLDQGEEVIRESQANLYRPLLKDINDNGARLWDSFAKGVTDQSFLVREQYGLNKMFGDTTKEFTDFLEKEIRESKKRNRKSGTTSPTPSSPPSPPQLPSSPTAPASTSPSTSSPTAPASTSPSTSASSSNGAISTPEMRAPIDPQTNAILDKLWGRTPGTTAQMQQRMQLDPGGTPAPSEISASPSSSPLASSNIPSDDVLTKMNVEQLKKFLRPDVSGANNKAVFDAAAQARREYESLRGTKKFDEEVIRASVRALRDSLQPVTPDRNLTRVKSGEGQGGLIVLPSQVAKVPPKQQLSGGVNPNSANDTPSPTAVNWTSAEMSIIQLFTGKME